MITIKQYAVCWIWIGSLSITLTTKMTMYATYRRIDVKYWSRKSLACSSTTSGFRASFVINGKFPPCIMLDMQRDREHASGWNVCWKWKKTKKNINKMNPACVLFSPTESHSVTNHKNSIKEFSVLITITNCSHV